MSRSRPPKKLASDLETMNALSMKYRIPTIDLGEFEIAPDVLRLVPHEVCARHFAIPVTISGGDLVVAMADPTDEAALAALRDASGLKIAPVISTERVLAGAIARYYGGRI